MLIIQVSGRNITLVLQLDQNLLNFLAITLVAQLFSLLDALQCLLVVQTGSSDEDLV